MTFAEALRQKSTVSRALKISAIIGTILIAVNQYDVLLSGQLPALWQIILTYAVPYMVSSYSSAAFMAEYARDKGKD